jgi:predicted MFS family arabinose efflux permease
MGMFVNQVASLLSPAVAIFLFTLYGLVPSMRIAYLIVLVFNFMAAVLRLNLKETLETTEQPRLANALRKYPAAVREGLGVWKTLPRSMVFLFLTNALANFVFAMTFSFLVVYAKNILHINEVTWALLMMWFTGSMILLALPSGKLTDPAGPKKPLLASWMLLAAYPVLFLWGSLPALYAAFLFFGASNTLFVAAYQALEADLVPRQLRGNKSAVASSSRTY